MSSQTSTESETPMVSPGSPIDNDAGKKSYFRRNCSRSHALAIEVLSIFPYGTKHGGKKDAWQKVADNMNALYPAANLSVSSVIKASDKMINTFRKQELASLRGSGNAEEFDDLCKCLTEIVELLDGLENKKEEKLKNEQKRCKD
jgi:hypothetical protein